MQTKFNFTIWINNLEQKLTRGPMVILFLNLYLLYLFKITFYDIADSATQLSAAWVWLQFDHPHHDPDMMTMLLSVKKRQDKIYYGQQYDKYGQNVFYHRDYSNKVDALH